MIFEIAQALVLVGIMVSAFIAVNQKDLLAAAISLGAMSLLISVEFYLLQAPDVALAEAAVGAALTTAIFVFAIDKTGRKEE